MLALEIPPLTAPQGQQADLSIPSRLELRFVAENDVTRMVSVRQQPPWRALRAFQNAQRQAVVHLHNVSGGIVSGDSLDLSLEAGPDTRVQITSVGATRIYRHHPGRNVARLCTSIRVDEGAIMEYLPDVMIPFRGSCFSQATSVSLGPNAGFICWETIAAGRIASREEFAFDLFRSEFSIRSETRMVALERYALTPQSRDLRSVARWGRFRYTAALYVCHTGIGRPAWLALESQLNELALLRSTDTARWGASTLVDGGLVVRGLALEAHQVTAGLYDFWDRAKQELWGERAVAPRKIN